MSLGDDLAPVLNSILASFERREESPNANQLHCDWMKTEGGREEVVKLTEAYERLSPDSKRELAMELARTGSMEIVPFLTKALADPSNARQVFPGLSYACKIADAGPEFRRAMAPAVVPWIGRMEGVLGDRAIELLPVLDAELAGRSLFNDEYLSKDAPLVDVVLASFNAVGVGVPLPRLRPLLKAWEATALEEDAENRVRRGYVEAVRALALHVPDEANRIAEELTAKNPLASDKYAEIPLAAAGLTRLYACLCDHANDPEQFGRLPEPARIYFAMAYFTADWSNGGISQALGNSTGDYLPLVKKGYREIGDLQGGALLQWMCKPFGSAGPSPDRKTRIRQMELMKPDYWEQEEGLSDSWWSEQSKATGPDTLWFLNLYAAKNASILKPLLEAAPNECE